MDRETDLTHLRLIQPAIQSDRIPPIGRLKEANESISVHSLPNLLRFFPFYPLSVVLIIIIFGAMTAMEACFSVGDEQSAQVPFHAIDNSPATLKREHGDVSSLLRIKRARMAVGNDPVSKTHHSNIFILKVAYSKR